MKKWVKRFFIVVAVVGILFLGGAFVYFQRAVSQGLGDTNPQACDRNPTPSKFDAAPYYTGPLFDTHLHIPSVLPPPKIIRDKLGLSQEYAVLGENVTMEQIVCLMDQENIVGALGFFPLGVDMPFIRKPFIDIAKRTVKTYEERIIPFIAPVPGINPVPQSRTLEKIFDQKDNVFKGYGEIPFYWSEFESLSPDSLIFLESYDTLEERNLMVMVHPNNGQIPALESVFARNPEVTFILHGMNEGDPFNHILSTYPNVYYTLDSPGLDPFFNANNKEGFLKEMNENFDALINRAIRVWRKVVENNPEKVMWGTDRFSSWSYNEEVGKVLEEYNRAFIGKLSPEVQELYAYKNAERLFNNLVRASAHEVKNPPRE
jgi:hypothetical protein